MYEMGTNVWLELAEGCRVRCTVSEDDEGNVASLLLGEPPHTWEFTIALEPMRRLVAQAAVTLAAMEATTRQDETESVMACSV